MQTQLSLYVLKDIFNTVFCSKPELLLSGTFCPDIYVFTLISVVLIFQNAAVYQHCSRTQERVKDVKDGDTCSTV